MVQHTEAQEVDEDSFFKMGESGGTKVSSAYQLCWDIIHERYDPDLWNIYPFHFSDGESCTTFCMTTAESGCGGRGTISGKAPGRCS